jgi:predicted O-methyltransferase YrrM
MRTLDQLRTDYLDLKITPTNWLGDSPTRFDTYKRYASSVNSIIEFGVYTGLSTCAWLSGHPNRLRSYDITDKYITVLDELKYNAEQNGTDFEFTVGNSLEVEAEECDLLFIDTVHKRDHCIAELIKHARLAKKYIVLHDPSDWPGVFEAVIDYLHHNRDWHIIEHCNKSSGLVVLERYND